MHFAIKVITLLLQYSSGSIIYFAFPSMGKSVTVSIFYFIAVLPHIFLFHIFILYSSLQDYTQDYRVANSSQLFFPNPLIQQYSYFLGRSSASLLGVSGKMTVKEYDILVKRIWFTYQVGYQAAQ